MSRDPSRRVAFEVYCCNSAKKRLPCLRAPRTASYTCACQSEDVFASSSPESRRAAILANRGITPDGSASESSSDISTDSRIQNPSWSVAVACRWCASSMISAAFSEMMPVALMRSRIRSEWLTITTSALPALDLALSMKHGGPLHG